MKSYLVRILEYLLKYKLGRLLVWTIITTNRKQQ